MSTRGLRAGGLQVIYMTSPLVYFLSFHNSLAKQNVAGYCFSCLINIVLKDSEEGEKMKELTAEEEEVGLHISTVFPWAPVFSGT